MVKRLVHAPNIIWSKTGGYWLHALAFTRQQQTKAVVLQRLPTVPVSGRLRQALKVGGKTFFAWAWRWGRVRGHAKSISYFITQ
mgnify:CR=1 FL=1